jgi:nucleotide-binding universal stress UspA family protein
MNILVAVDGSPCSLRAVRYAADRLRAARGAKLHLLNVQPPVMSGNVTRFVSKAMIEDYHREQGERALAKARRLLDAARLPYVPHIVTGPVAQTIVDAARAFGCGEIVMGTRGHGAVARLVLGSVATKVVHLARQPVTLVK